ncbi:MAG: hypothetical protein MK165_01825 [Pirellulaceae bacterium]|nr:hypothetical protein [Pirellulaceae bacterium]
MSHDRKECETVETKRGEIHNDYVEMQATTKWCMARVLEIRDYLDCRKYFRVVSQPYILLPHPLLEWIHDARIF